MSIRDRATPFHGGYRIEQKSVDTRRASLFLFVYPYGRSGTVYVLRRGLAMKREIMRVAVEGPR
jgi:hypothetical protein